MKGSSRTVLLIIFMFLLAGIAVNCRAQQVLPSMVLVQGGRFEMGMAGGKDNPQHSIELSDFYISSFDVMVNQWRTFTHETHASFDWNADYSGGGSRPMAWNDDSPIEWVTWYEALEYCNWLSEKSGLQSAYRIEGTIGWKTVDGNKEFVRPKVKWELMANGFRLPTEAEWEYAARGGKKSKRTAYAGSNDINESVWYRGNSGGRTHSVGQKQPNELGLYDMSGNVAEWCWDFYDTNYYKNSSSKNPTGPNISFSADQEATARGWTFFLHVARGGSSRDGPIGCTVYARNAVADLNRLWIGFRVARNAE